MPSWANQLGQQFDDDMIDPGQHVLTVGGLTTAGGGLRVGAAGNQMILESAANESRIEAPIGNGVLRLNADVPLETGDVIISHRDNAPASEPTVIIRSPRLRIGSPAELPMPAQDGFIDANGQDAPLAGNALNIGTQQRTRNVVIGRSDAADPNTNVTLKSPVLIGNALGIGVGRVDAEFDGAAPRNLEIGGQNSTANVILGRANQNVQLSTILSMGVNALQFAVGGATFQLVGNGAGHGWGVSLDVTLNGNVIGWADSQGIHVQPLPNQPPA